MSSTTLLKILRNMLLIVLLLHAGTNNLFAQQDTDQQLPISLNEAIEIALVNSYVLQRSNLSIEEADKQILQAWGTVYPQIGGTTSYTRNVKTPNPFAGSDAEGLFSSFAALGWLAFNENQRQNNNPTLSFDDYNQNVSDGYDAAGIQLRSSDNPFAIENQFIMGVSATQAIYNGAAFAAIRGAEQLRQIVKNQLERDTQTMVNEVRTTYLRALLANEQVKLLESSLGQLKETKREISALVDQGLLSRFDRNSLEVEIVNLETNLIAAQNGTALATRSINIVLGIPTYIDLRLTDSFENYSLQLPEISKRDEAFEIALQQRADLRQADGAIRFREAERELIRATYFPIVNAFANYAYVGNVPDNRTQVRSVQNQDFTYTSTERSFFHNSYWNASFAVGLRLQWSIFNGFQTRARMQQVAVNIKRAELDALMLRESVYLQVDASLRNVESSWLRIQSQKRNIELAELNYSDAKSRLREGIGTRLEERQASSLLDQSRLNYLAAIHDYLVAKSEYDTALGLRTVEIQITD